MQPIQLSDHQHPPAEPFNSHDNKPIYIPVRDFCEISGLALSTAYELCAAGVLPGVLRVGRRILVNHQMALSHLEQVAREGGQL